MKLYGGCKEHDEVRAIKLTLKIPEIPIRAF